MKTCQVKFSTFQYSITFFTHNQNNTSILNFMFPYQLELPEAGQDRFTIKGYTKHVIDQFHQFKLDRPD